jgi:hypothetical protein
MAALRHHFSHNSTALVKNYFDELIYLHIDNEETARMTTVSDNIIDIQN